MTDQLNTSTDSIEILDEDGNVISKAAPEPKSSPTAVPMEEDAPEAPPVPRGNALYARLAVLMTPSVTVADALTEMKEMSRQIVARKRAAGVSELWDPGEEVVETAASAGPPGSIRPPPKRTGPPSAVVSGSANRLHVSPSMADKQRAAAARPGGAVTVDKSSSSGSEESQDASAVSLEARSKSFASDVPKASNKVCIICYDAASAPGVNPLLTCAVCSLRTHAKCAKPQIDKEELSSARFSFTCATCARRPRSESPKPSARGAPIQITAPHDKRRKTEDSKLSKTEDARRKRLEGEVKKKKSEEL